MSIIEQKAVLDRIEGSTGILLLGESENIVNVPLQLLPSGVREGDWFTVNLSDGRLTAIRPCPGETARRRSAIEAKLEKLRNKNK
ncbi:MAG: DUF3006 domain-containing protein [Dehalococcoidia bacterium]|nr:DUF3006 domain-containing protein [Dehalococcoidia bacterium]